MAGYLHFSLGLHPEARYPTRSSFVSGSVATMASSVGGLAATISWCRCLRPRQILLGLKICFEFMWLLDSDDNQIQVSFILDASILLIMFTTALCRVLQHTASDRMQNDGPVWGTSAMFCSWTIIWIIFPSKLMKLYLVIIHIQTLATKSNSVNCIFGLDPRYLCIIFSITKKIVGHKNDVL